MYMNSTPIPPSDLINEGAYVGNIMDFINNEEYNEMLSVIEKVRNYSIVNRNTELYCRYMINGEEGNYEHRISLNKIEERDQYIKENNLTIFQKWFEYSMKTDPGNPDYFDFFKDFCKRILDYFYPDYEINYGARTGGFTLYEDGHFITDHKDGNNPGRVCVIIIYLSSESEYNNDGGGELVIKTNSQKEYTIKPILGTFSLLDFSENDVHHQVNMVKNGFKRYAFINFFNAKEGQKFKTKKMLL
jgi:Rps23 Pro-64 3,4-dihydroxylase Tpa1-like proline 4-hydroxylase